MCGEKKYEIEGVGDVSVTLTSRFITPSPKKRLLFVECGKTALAPAAGGIFGDLWEVPCGRDTSSKWRLHAKRGCTERACTTSVYGTLCKLLYSLLCTHAELHEIKNFARGRKAGGGGDDKGR